MELRDPVSSASHLLTAIWAVYATLILIRLTPPQHARKLAVAVFGISMVLLYLASGTFHGLYYETAEQRRFFQKLDQSAIFMLIAGTNTPILVILLGGRTAKLYLSILWGLAGLGIFCLWLLPKAPHWVMVMNYLAIGWLGFMPARQYVRCLNWQALRWVLYGAFWYSFGAICELTDWPVIIEWPVRVAAHEVLHICDTLGSMSFFVFIARYVVPYGNPIMGTTNDPQFTQQMPSESRTA
jgi:hemolysin III